MNYVVRKLYIWSLRDLNNIKEEFMRVEARVRAKNIILQEDEKEIQKFVRKYINTNN